MRLLIAGWQGQIARSLVELALGRDDVSGLSVGRPALDLFSASSVKSSLVGDSPDIMINTAAYTAVDQAEEEPEQAFKLNTAGAASFAATAAKLDIPVIHLSTAYVFDGEKDAPYTEEDTPAPKTVYGQSKLQSETEVAAANPRHVILRTAWVYSPYSGNFVSSMLSKARKGEEIEVVDDQTGSPTYALDLARAILDIAAAIATRGDDTPWGTYHVASTGEATWYGFANKIFDISRGLGGPTAEPQPISTDAYPTTAIRLANARLDSSKVSSAFGIEPAPWEKGVETCVRRVLAEDED